MCSKAIDSTNLPTTKRFMKATHLGLQLTAMALAASCAIQWAVAGPVQPIDNLVYSAGTTIADAQKRQWAYVLWQGTKPELVRNKSFAIYAKAGDANSVALYERRAVVRLETDPRIIEALLTRSVNLGEDRSLLEEHVANLFQKLAPPANATLSDKLSIIIRSALDDPEHSQTLWLVSRLHPAVSLAIGFAHAE